MKQQKLKNVIADIDQPPITTHKRWHGLAQSIEQEHDFQALRVEGKLPNDINGTFYQNGPGLFERDEDRYTHVFDCDGLMRAVKIQDGGATGAAKIVQSEGLLAERQAGKTLMSGIETTCYGLKPSFNRLKALATGKIDTKNNANTSLVIWQDRLLALYEASPITELNPQTLEIIGETTLGGVIKGSFTAHPHWVSERKTSFGFGVDLEGLKTVLNIYELPSSGPCKVLTQVALKWRPVGYVHDFIATPNYLVFFIPPIHLPASKLYNVVKGDGNFTHIEWRDSLGSEVIIIPIDNPKNVTRFKCQPFIGIHFANAFEENGKIITDFTYSQDTVLYKSIGPTPTLPSQQSVKIKYLNRKPHSSVLKRATIDVQNSTIGFNTLWNNFCEFPKINPGLQGSNYQFIYMLQQSDSCAETTPFFSDIVKLNTKTGDTEVLELGSELYPAEPLFIRKQDALKEDEGYLLCMVYDGNINKNHIIIIDAQDIMSGPIAKIHFEQAMPFGFHCFWHPAK